MSAGRARILSIQRMSTEDGPGIRSTVFFKGCSLRCRWCQNPESISTACEVIWNDYRCLACKSCLEACASGLLSLSAGGMVRADDCRACGDCVQACPSGAMELLGRDWSLQDLLSELLKDRVYYERSGGGVTISAGGDGCAAELGGACRASGLHLALDTCGQAPPEAFLRLVRQADLLLFDLKAIDSGLHRRLCGQGSERILENLSRLAQQDVELWIRTPLVPGDTDSDENIRAIAHYLRDHLAGRVARWELCAFNGLCQDKYRRLGRVWPYAGSSAQGASRVEALRAIALESELEGECLRITGALAREDAC